MKARSLSAVRTKVVNDTAQKISYGVSLEIIWPHYCSYTLSTELKHALMALLTGYVELSCHSKTLSQTIQILFHNLLETTATLKVLKITTKVGEKTLQDKGRVERAVCAVKK
jgi:hypothetical protein